MDGFFHRQTGRITPHKSDKLLQVGRRKLGVGHVLECNANQLFAAVAHDFAQSLVDVQEAALFIDIGDAYGRESRR